MRVPFASFMAITVLVALSACGGGLKGVVNNAVCNFSTPLPTAVPQMSYPIPGALQVPDNAPAMVVGFSGNPVLAGTISIQANGGPVSALGPMGAAPKVMPTPFAPIQTGSVAYGVTMPTLKAHTAYGVTYRYLTSISACGSNNTQTAILGGFVTQ